MSAETGIVGPRIRPALHALKPYVPGKSLESVQRELGLTELVKMNQNENPLGPSPAAMVAAAAAMSEMHTYPEGSSPVLRERLAALWDLPPGWFLVGNGSDEVFRLLAEAYLEPGDAVVVPAPSFAGYPLVAELMGAQVVRVPLVNDTMDVGRMAAEAIDRGAPLLFLCRPNSPTGAVFSEDDLRAVLPSIPPSTLVVVDEAYREFDQTAFDSRALVGDHPNVIVTRTFSKIYGLAGLRLGYGVMRPEVLAPLMRIRDPFSVNSLAMAAGTAALSDRNHLERSLTLVHEGKRYLAAFFEQSGIPYVPTQANFILFHTRAPAPEVYDGLLRRGILIRPCASFGLPHSLRVTIGTMEQNEAFTAALGDILRGQ